ncbi:kinase-like domain-containing protein [Daldinia loculata]|nr:kinase-like domain-containing protein [Daldinia loculata]
MERLRLSHSPEPSRHRSSSRGFPSSSTRNPATSPQVRHPLGLRESPITSSHQASSSIYPHSTTYSPERSSSRYYPPSATRYPAESSRDTRRSSSRDRGPSRGESSRGESSRGESSRGEPSRGESSRGTRHSHPRDRPSPSYDPPPRYKTLPSRDGRPPSPPPPPPPPSPPPSPPPGGPSPPESDSSDSSESEYEPAPSYRTQPTHEPRPPTALNLLERARGEAREILRQRARTEARNIRSFFQRDERNFQYLGIAGHGANSVAVKVKLRSRWFSRHSSRTFVVKRAIVAGIQRKLRNENRILRMLRGAKHIVQLYRTSGIRNPIDRARGRTVIMEWAPNGTLGNFITRLARSRDHQSNRMLHILFMCLVRMCIAMAFPPRQGRRARPQRETLPDSRAARERKTQLIHHDMHTHNILFGDVEPPGDGDHYVLPPLKLIDFEDAEVLSDPQRHNQAVQSNILSIGMIMRCIITGNTNMNAHAVPVRINVSGLNVTITSYANFPSNTYPDIDDDIKSLVVQCCAVNPQERPTLEDLYGRARSHLRNREYDYYRATPSAPYERKPWITRLVQEYILNADST